MKFTIWRDGCRVFAFRLHVGKSIYGLNVQARWPILWAHKWGPCEFCGRRHDNG